MPKDISLRSWRDVGILTCLSFTSMTLQLLLLECSNLSAQNTINFSHKLILCQILLLVLLRWCFFLFFKRIETEKIFWIKICWGMLFWTLWLLISGRVITLTSVTATVFSDLLLQQLLNILVEFIKEKGKSIVWINSRCD